MKKLIIAVLLVSTLFTYAYALDVTFTMTGTNATRVVDALCATYNYQAKIDDGNGNLIDNPETKAQFAKRMTKEWWLNIVVAYEKNKNRAEKDTEFDGNYTQPTVN